MFPPTILNLRHRCRVFAGALLFAFFTAQAADTNLTIGFCTADFATAKAAGFEFGEVRIREFVKLSDADFSDFARKCETNGLPLLTGYWLFPGTLKVVGPDVRMDEVTNYLEKVFERSQKLGVKKIVFGSGEARRAPENFSKEQAFEQLVALGKIMAVQGRAHGIMVIAEPLRRAEGNMINSATEGLRWVEAVNDPNFQLLVDIYHMSEENEDMSIIVQAGAHIAHVHVSNPHGRVFPLHADEFDYAPFFRALKKINYHGTMSIETATVDVAKDGPKAIQFIRDTYASTAVK